MQPIGDYVIFMLTVVALGLAPILFGVIVVGAYEGASWLRATHQPGRTGDVTLGKLTGLSTSNRD
jgi:hypothetical protein